MAKATGTGKGGKTLNDRLLAANVRTLALKEIEKVLLDQSEEILDYKRQLLLKLATTVLPRLNEHSGPEGKPIPIMSIDNAILRNDSDQEDQVTEEEN